MEVVSAQCKREGDKETTGGYAGEAGGGYAFPCERAEASPHLVAGERSFWLKNTF